MCSYQLSVYSPLTLAAATKALSSRDDARPALAAALRSDSWPHVTLTDSGTSALALALQASASMRDNLPCALPAYGCFDLVSAALAAGVRVRFYDVDPSTLGPDSDSLRQALARGCSSVVLVHPFGINVGSDALARTIRSASALLISDCAQADGLTIPAVEADWIVRSFGRGKGWTGGGGGALMSCAAIPPLANLPDAAESGVAGIRFAIVNGAQWLLGRPSLYGLPSLIPALGLGETAFKAPLPPRRISARSARLAMATAPLLDRERAQRRANAIEFAALPLEKWGWRRPEVAANSSMGWLRYPIMGSPRGIADTRWRRLGISRGYPVPLPHLLEAQPIIDGGGSAAGAETIVAQLWSLPTHHYVSQKWRVAITRWLETHSPISRP